MRGLLKAWGTCWVRPSGLRSATGRLAGEKKSLPVNYTNGARSVGRNVNEKLGRLETGHAVIPCAESSIIPRHDPQVGERDPRRSQNPSRRSRSHASESSRGFRKTSPKISRAKKNPVGDDIL